MRLLVVAPFVPNPRAKHGGGAYLGSLAGALGKQAGIGLVALATPDEETNPDQTVPWQWRRLVVTPAPRRGLLRLPHQLRMLWHWRHLPLVAAKAWHPDVVRAIAAARAEWRPDAALVEMAQMAQYLPALHGLPTVLTDHENGCPANTRTGLGPAGDRRDRALWQRYVRHFYAMADVVQALTAEDAHDLHVLLGRDVEVRPPVHETPPQPASPALAPPRALFLGDYRHQPNPEAARVLVRDVLPAVRQAVPSAELWLAGPNGDGLADLASAPGVRILGFVPDLASLFRDVRMVLAPVWSGGGFRMKSLAALAHGVPVVTNALGARGCMPPVAARVVVESVADLAAATVTWLRDASAAGLAGAAAYAWARQELAVGAVATRQLTRLRRLVDARR